MKKETLKNIITKSLLGILFFAGIYVFLFVSGYVVAGNDVFAAQTYLLIVSTIAWVCCVIGKNISEKTETEKQEQKKRILPQNRYEKFLQYWRNLFGFLLLAWFVFILLTGHHFWNTARMFFIIICSGCFLSFIATFFLTVISFVIKLFRKNLVFRSSYCLHIAFHFLLFFICIMFMWAMYVAPYF